MPIAATINAVRKVFIRLSYKLTVAEANRLAGLCEGILADDEVSHREAEFLSDWLATDDRYLQDPRSKPVAEAVTKVLADHSLSLSEAAELRTVLSEFCDQVLSDETPITRRPLKQRFFDALAGKITDTHSDWTSETEPRRPRRAKRDYPKHEKPYTPVAPVSGRKKRKSTTNDATPPDSGDVFDISYTDAKGDISDRLINFRSCSRKNGVAYVNAICLTRNAFRTFRADRICAAIHTGTGEWIDDPKAYFSAA